MTKNIIKKISAIGITLSLALFLIVPISVGAVVGNGTDNFGLNTNFNGVDLGQGSDLKGSMANIINIVLGFLGIIAVIIIMAGGFKWMTAGGAEEKVDEARKMIIQGVIGMVIIFAAWAIAGYVVGLAGNVAA